MKYNKLIKEEFVKEQLQMIDSKEGEYISHGLRHAVNVVSNIEKIAKILDINEKTVEYLKIAGYLHDFGQLYGREQHFIKSRELVAKYLENKVSIEWYNRILGAIEKHHEKENVDELSLFEHIVLFADKMDFSCKRLNSVNKDYFESNILKVDFAATDNKFIVIIKFKDKESSTKFFQWNMYPGIEQRIIQFTRKLNMDYEIKLI